MKVIPMAKATGSWKGKSSEFWVYGNDKVAYAPRYNKEFYHGCSILLGVCSIKQRTVTVRGLGGVAADREEDGWMVQQGYLRLFR